MSIVITGAFKPIAPNGERLSYTRAEVEQMCAAAGYTVQQSVSYDTVVVYAANPRAGTSKLLAAERQGISVLGHQALYVILVQRFTDNPNGFRVDDNGVIIRHFATSRAAGPNMQQVARPTPGGKALGYPAEIALGIKIERATTINDLRIQRRVKL